MKLFPLTSLLVHAAAAVFAAESEDSYLADKCVPLVREFLKRNAIAYDAAFPTQRISHSQVDYTARSGVYLSRLMLDRRFSFLFTGTGGTNGITFFVDKASSWSPRLLDPQNEAQMLQLASASNCLSISTALDLANRYFHLQGHQQKNFHPVVFRQITWAESVPSRRIVLPFYEAEWVRRDVPLPVEKNESIYPSVTVIVSGLKSNFIAYSKILLPFGYGRDFD